jgi:hypothetical protein
MSDFSQSQNLSDGSGGRRRFERHGRSGRGTIFIDLARAHLDGADGGQARVVKYTGTVEGIHNTCEASLLSYKEREGGI